MRNLTTENDDKIGINRHCCRAPLNYGFCIFDMGVFGKPHILPLKSSLDACTDPVMLTFAMFGLKVVPYMRHIIILMKHTHPLEDLGIF